jgi:AcrR family transcriptional regulator
MTQTEPSEIEVDGTDPGGTDADGGEADWQRRVVGRSLRTATKRSIDRGSNLIRAAATLLERSNGDGFTVQDVADEAGQSLRTLYQYFESKDDLLLAVFEEAMRTYARMIREAIVDLTDPLERLGGGMIASLRMQEFSDTGVDRGLARLRLKLGEVEPSLVARSQEPVTAVIRELVEEAADAGQIETSDPEHATYLILALKSSYITSLTLGNDFGVAFPSVPGLTAFCLQGLGAPVDDAWIEQVDRQLKMPGRRIRLEPGSGAKRPPRAKRGTSTSRSA